MRQRILFVSDGSFDQTRRAALAEHRFELTESAAGQALPQLAKQAYDLVIISLRDATEAIDLLKTIRANAELNRVQTLLIAEWGTGQAALALPQGADAFEPAPIDARRLVESVEKLLRPRMVMTASASNADREMDD